MTFNYLIFSFWIVFIAYWFFSALNVKKNVQEKGDWARGAGVRIILIVLALVVIRFSSLQGFSIPNAGLGSTSALVINIIGTVLCGFGIAFAIWARWHLGRNWSATPSVKEGHELVTSGPYRFVRHPIYTGMITAIFGSALVGGLVWFIVFIIFLVMFVWRIKVEEAIMMQIFPQQYPEYKKHSKALIPFVW